MAQDSLYLEVFALDQPKGFFKKHITYQQAFEDDLDVEEEMTEILNQLYDQSYLSASVDSIYRGDSIRQAFLFVGAKYEWANLKNGNVKPQFLNQVGYKEKLYSGKPFNYKELRKLQESLLSYAENNGYPFATVRLDSIRIVDDQIAARIYMRPNRLIYFDGVEIEGDVKISEKFMATYLGLKKGTLYDESKLLKVRNRIKELGYLKEKKSLNVIFAEDKATVHLFLENKKASRFDLLVGFLPRTEETGKFQLTGNAEIDLKNPFGTGKQLRIKWQQLRLGTQELDAFLAYPYVFNLPFGADFTFNLYKRDTSYLDLKRDLGIQYHFEGNNYLKVYWDNKRTTILNIDTDQILLNRKLPNNLDVGASIFGLAYHFENLDYRFNPRKGFDFLIKGGAGIKRILKSNSIVDLADPENLGQSFDFLYDSLNLRTFQFRMDADIAYYQPIGTRSVMKMGVQAAYVQSGETLFQNELYRIGGNKTLRGFDEEAIFASLYSVFTAEYRFIIGENSFLYAFGDYAYLQNKSTLADLDDHPFGFGVGMTFETKAGVFGISYALGRQMGNPIDLRAGKIHLGYVNYF